MTKANQVAPLLATLRGLIPDATEAIDEFAKLAKYVDEVEARAEQAEYSLAASERALAALRYQAQAGGCELSTVGENSYHCRTDALCGLCRLRHRASQAERSLATLRELIHTASGLDDHRYSAEQMVKEMAERWQGASDDCEKAEQALATVTAERDEARVRERGWQWRPVGDGAFAPPFGTIRVCLDCGCLVSGGPTRCVRCAEPPATRAELEALRVRVERLEQLTGFVPKE